MTELAEPQVEVSLLAVGSVATAVEEKADRLVGGTRGRGALTSKLHRGVSHPPASRASGPVAVTPPFVGEQRPRDVGFGANTCAVDDRDEVPRAPGVAHPLSERLHTRLVLVHPAPARGVPAQHGVDGGPAHRPALCDPADGVASAVRSVGAGEAQETTRASLDDVRRIARRLRPEALDDLGLPAALTALASGFSEQTGLRVSRRIDRNLTALDPEAELVVYRVAQESLTNVVRHAGASRVELHLERGPRGATVLRVLDDGAGLDAARPGSGIAGSRA